MLKQENSEVKSFSRCCTNFKIWVWRCAFSHMRIFLLYKFKPATFHDIYTVLVTLLSLIGTDQPLSTLNQVLL